MARQKQPQVAPQHTCREGRHCDDWHEKNWQGELFMCRCPHYKEGKFSKFLDDPQCEKFELKNNGSTEQMGQ